MTEGFKLGLSLMAIGMATVFVMLWLVVLGGAVLIRIINRFYPDTVTTPAASSEAIKENNKKIAAITAVVEAVTGGKGKVVSIKKI